MKLPTEYAVHTTERFVEQLNGIAQQFPQATEAVQSVSWAFERGDDPRAYPSYRTPSGRLVHVAKTLASFTCPSLIVFFTVIENVVLLEEVAVAPTPASQLN